MRLSHDGFTQIPPEWPRRSTNRFSSERAQTTGDPVNTVFWKKKMRNFIYGMLTALLVVTSPNIEGQNDSLESAAVVNWTSDALKTLTGSTQLIEAAPSFSVRGDAAGELLMSNGQWVEYGTTFNATFVRPSKLHLYMNSRDGIETTLVFNGSTITVAILSDGQHTYDTTPQLGDANDSLNFLMKYVGGTREMLHFLTKQLTQSLSNMQSGLSLGKSTIDGVVCDHLALRTDTRDIQVWIAQGDEPTLQRMLITHRNKPGQPRFWIQFEEWNLSPEFSESTFTYLPPEGAKRVLYFQD